MKVDLKKCTGCAFCVRDCPVAAVRLVKKKAVIDEKCTDCGACIMVCEAEALVCETTPTAGAIQCEACPIGCRIKPGFIGSCHRYKNVNERLERITPLHTYTDVADVVGSDDPSEAIRRPLITAIGAGTTYPDAKPAPIIVKGKQMDVDVVTVVTEAPLSYSGITVKIDTDIRIGDEGAPVRVGKRKVGMLVTEQYGSKMISIGGVNLLTGKEGLLVARTITDIANKKKVRLKIDQGGMIEVKVGQAPIINGQTPNNMRVGCGSATLGLFAPLLQKSADEVIILDSHFTGLMSEHAAGRFVGAKPSGIKLKFRQSTPGRYFGDHGEGWGGTSIIQPLDVISEIDRNTARIGMRILITETTGQNAGLFEIVENFSLHKIPLSNQAKKALSTISASCEPSLVSGIYTGGTGGSARAGVVRYPVKLTHAVHRGTAHLSVGGAPTFVLPGGGINFMVDVGRVKANAFYWTPTPATICPIEYTMKLKDYEQMGGHLRAMRPFTAKEPLAAVD